MMNERGRSMIEMLGVLAIIGVLSVGGIAGFSKAMEKYRVNKTIQQVSYIAGNIRTLFGSQKDYSDGTNLGTDGLKKAKVVPEEMIDGNSLKNPFGGDVNIMFYEGYEFYIEYHGIPQDACIALATQDWEAKSLFVGAERKDGFLLSSKTACTPKGCYDIACHGREDSEYCADYKENGLSGKYYSTDDFTAIPMPVEKAVEACASADYNVIYWYFD